MQTATVALMFPGQGSQRSGMGRPWVDSPGWPLVDEASALLDADLAALLLDADAEALRGPWAAQVSTLLTSLLALRAVQALGLDVVAVAGHSLGEYTALVAAGVLAPAEAVRLVGERGAAMQAAAEAAAGTMAAVLGLDDADVEAICAAGQDVWPANYNAPGHVVVSGTTDGVAAAGERAKAAGARRVLAIAVGGAYHTPLMAPARARLQAALAVAPYAEPAVPVIANVDAAPHGPGTDWPELLAAQLTSPVRWRQSLATAVGLGVGTLVEVGPGGVLTGLAKRAAPELARFSVASPEDVATLAEAGAA